MSKMSFAVLAAVCCTSAAYAKCEKGERVVRFGIPNSSGQTAMDRLAKEVQTQFQRVLNGRACVELIRSDAFNGSGKELDALRENAADIIAPTFTSLAIRFPRYRIFDLPFAFTDRFAVKKYLASKSTEYWERDFTAIEILPFPLAIFGLKQLGAKKAVFEPADAVGLKFAMDQGQPTREMLSLMKATGQPVARTDLPSAVKDGRVEAQFSDWWSMQDNKTGEIHAAIMETNFAVKGAQIVGSIKWQQSLRPRMREPLNKAIRGAIDNFNTAEQRRLSEAKSRLLENGRPVYIVTRQQRAAWIKLFEPLWGVFRGTQSGAKQLQEVVESGR